LLVYDPFASYRNVDFVTDSEEWISEVANARLNAFRYGRVLPDDLPLLGKAAFCAGDCSLVIEECALLFQRGAELDIWAKNLIFMGRHQRVNLVLIAQRANKIPIDIRSQASRIVTFRQTEPDDVSALSDRIGRASRDELPTLPELHCIDWNNGKINRYSVRP
jgi:DNA helicase HerA-like ATPase